MILPSATNANALPSRAVPLDRAEICAVVVTYNPDESFEENLEQLRRQTGGVVIVDNGSQPTCLQRLKTIAKSQDIEIIFNGINLGIAAALNIGVQAASKSGFHWVLTMDQDSFPLENMVGILIRAYSECPYPEKIAAVGSRFQERGRKRKEEKGNLIIQNNRAWIKTMCVITSGTLLSVPIYRIVGPFRNDFFIDYVDTEWCFRARTFGYEIITATEIGMVHQTGHISILSLLNCSSCPFHAEIAIFSYFHTPFTYMLCHNTINYAWLFAYIIPSLSQDFPLHYSPPTSNFLPLQDP
ncbi:MAG: hypothetical protein DDT29_01397 [Dehalococcoidia bacterium]|nr:hypothetical protein [Bacillota bacterium]